MRQRQPAHFQHIGLSQRIKHFLATYKVNFCPNPYPHQIQFCNQYHSDDDKRRPPYRDEGFAYNILQICLCKQEDCKKCHNIYEYFYHPLFYKTSKCTNYNCGLGLYCYLLHDNEADLLSRYKFFRFELETFKTEICPHRQQSSNMHELASCHHYHNDSDKRRNPRKVAYSHVQCSKSNCTDPLCRFAHNKIQQLYHPSRYKTKYCQSYINKKGCQYHQYCSFAHSDHEIKIQLLHLMDKNIQFYNYKYKTVWCPYTNQHVRSDCPYAHNFQDYRRDPKKIKYTPEACPNWAKGQIKSIEDSGCPLRMECPKSHGWLEKKYHPDLEKWKAGQSEKVQVEQIQSEPVVSTQSNGGSFVLGAPFFQQHERGRKTERSQSSKKSSRNKTKEKGKSIKQTEKWFNFSFFLPDNDSFSGQNNENASKIEFEECWQTNKKEERKGPHSPLFKQKTVKKHKTEYTKSLKQLLVSAGLEEKLSVIKINQIKLLSLSPQELDQIGLNHQEKQQLHTAIQQYSKTHKLDKVKYTDSLIKVFRKGLLLKTLQKMREKGVTQNTLRHLGSSSIDDLSFLEEEEKSRLPKILEEYADNRDFRELKTEIDKQQGYLKVRKSKKVPFYSFKE